MTRDDVKNSYFEWLCSFVEESKYSKHISYRKLLTFLHSTEFIFVMSRDRNRADDGIALRYRFGMDTGITDAELYLDGPCSVLEMMVALALRCEETITDDPRFGNRTSQWIRKMIVNLGLGSMTDDRFNKAIAHEIIETFLHREYRRDGKGGLFIVKGLDEDLRDLEIWHQLCRYINTITSR